MDFGEREMFMQGACLTLGQGGARATCPYDKMNSTSACDTANVFHREGFFLNPIIRKKHKDANAL